MRLKLLSQSISLCIGWWPATPMFVSAEARWTLSRKQGLIRCQFDVRVHTSSRKFKCLFGWQIIGYVCMYLSIFSHPKLYSLLYCTLLTFSSTVFAMLSAKSCGSCVCELWHSNHVFFFWVARGHFLCRPVGCTLWCSEVIPAMYGHQNQNPYSFPHMYQFSPFHHDDNLRYHHFCEMFLPSGPCRIYF